MDIFILNNFIHLDRTINCDDHHRLSLNYKVSTPHFLIFWLHGHQFSIICVSNPLPYSSLNYSTITLGINDINF